MPRKTNKEKFDKYLELIKPRLDSFIKENVSELPEKIYEVARYKIRELIITKIKYSDQQLWCFEKPTNKEVAEIKDFYENPKELSTKNIYIHYHGDKFSGAFSLKDIYEKDSISFNKEDLLEYIKKLEELYKPRTGYSPCVYCQKQVPNDKLIERTIIHQASNEWGKKYIAKTKNKYCSGTCAAYDQMAHEG